MEVKMDNHIYDVLIIGGGPGGIQTALTYSEVCRENGTEPNMVVLEAFNRAGYSFTKYPVHEKLISNNKLYTGKPFKSRYAERFDWNSLITKEKNILMRNYSQDFYPNRKAIVDMLNDLIDECHIPISYDTQWIQTNKTEQGLFEVVTTKGTFTSRTVVVATGLKPVIPKIEGIEHITMYENMKTKESYRDKRVLILGKGNSGLECAQEILNEANVIMLASPSSAKMAYKTHYVGNIRAVNSIFAENYQLKHQAALLDCHIKSIEKVATGFNVTVEYIHAEGEVETLFFNEVIAATGFKSNIDQLIKDFNIQLMHKKFPSINGVFESTEVSNLYFAGAQTHGLDYRGYSTSGFIHGFRYNSRILANHLAEKFNISKMEKSLVQDPSKRILDELNESPELWLQPGYVGYQLKFDGHHWYENGHRTINEFKDSTLNTNELTFFISLEYGDIRKFEETFSIPRVPGDATQSVHIHPVIRVKQGDEIIKYDLEEHLESKFDDDLYIPVIKEIVTNALEKESSLSY